MNDDPKAMVYASWYDRGWDTEGQPKCMACGSLPDHHEEECVIGQAEPAFKEILGALDDACDVAIWLTGVADLSEVEAWPEMREKLIRSLAVAHPEGTIMHGDEVVGYALREGGSDE